MTTEYEEVMSGIVDIVGCEVLLLEALYELRDKVDNGETAILDFICTEVGRRLNPLVTIYNDWLLVEAIEQSFCPIFASWRYTTRDPISPVPGGYEGFAWVGHNLILRTHLLDHLIFCLEDGLGLDNT